MPAKSIESLKFQAIVQNSLEIRYNNSKRFLQQNSQKFELPFLIHRTNRVVKN